MADVVVPALHPAPAPPPGAQPHLLLLPSLPYNITLNITSILSLLPSSSFLTRSRLFTSIRRKWWQDVVDMGVVASETVGGAGGGGLATGTGATAQGGIVVDIAAWPTESMLEAVVNEASSGSAGSSTAAAAAPTASAVSATGPAMYMGPWSFFTSGYMLGLFLVAVLLHRIQNIIIPSRVPSRRGGSSAWIRRFAVLDGLWGSLLPLDLSKTSTRLVLHLPSLYFLCKWLFVWFVLVLQTSHLYPVDTGIDWIERLGNWVEHKGMSEVCWNTFVSVCAGFTVEGFVKALDGVEAGFPIGSNMNPNTSPFNIVGYAFLLHLYASPFAHGFRTAKDLPSRPDKHAIITITIPLLQLTMFHALSVSRRLSTHRLLPTTLSSLLSLMHFHGALLSYFYSSDWYVLQTASNPPSMAPQTRLLTTYPILNYIPNIFETLLILTISLTVVLNVVVQLIVRGRVDRVFSGLGIGPTSSFYSFTNMHQGQQHNSDDEADQRFPTMDQAPQRTAPTGFGQAWAFFQSLPFDEDFGVLLLRIGTASLEATGLRGWSNEVAPIPAPVRRDHQRGSAATGGATGGQQYGSVRVGRLGAGGVRPGFKVPSGNSGVSSRANILGGESSADGVRKRRKGRTVATQGLRNEVRVVDLGLGPSSTGRRRRGFWERGAEMLSYFEAVWAALKGFLIFLKAWMVYLIKGRQRGKRMRGLHRGERRSGRPGGDEDENAAAEDSEDSVERDREIYQRFLRGDNISDDEEEDEEYRVEDGDEFEGREEEEEDSQHDNEEDEGREAFGLFTDILKNGIAGGSREGGRGGGGGDVVLAHLVDKSPMTRRRWNSLSSLDQAKAPPRQLTPAWDAFYDDDDLVVPSSSPVSTAVLDAGREIAARSVCVICTSEARDVICWPCRCLAMCDGCREALAGRSASAKHRCPCCRQLIEGYSKIYVP